MTYEKLLRSFCQRSVKLRHIIDGVSNPNYATPLTSHSDLLCSPEEYVRLLGGIGGFKKATQGTTTPFGAFCSKKLEEMNIGALFFTFPYCYFKVLMVHPPLRQGNRFQDNSSEIFDIVFHK